MREIDHDLYLLKVRPRGENWKEEEREKGRKKGRKELRKGKGKEGKLEEWRERTKDGMK